ncbi:S1C family serine protease [Miniphocaeibacter massiliensis]|uniref:S1C family serine protease n=1 Tax=Miniphocaeibacter massiliensis TaxID=2041841 RepID=UPI001F5E1C02|nr:trypsin-like peptidase domain-containing protein [Miniphocaeibacter massiliensis]
MNDDRKNYNEDSNENEFLKDNIYNSEEEIEDIDNENTTLNDFSKNREIYNPRGTEDEGQVLINSGTTKNYRKNYNENYDDIRYVVKEEMKKSKPKNLWFKFVAVALLFSLIGSGITGLIMGKMMDSRSSSGLNTGKTSGQVINVKEDSNVENAVAAKAIPSVVGITTSTAQTIPYLNQQAYAEGVGSGVIITDDGYILTNSHVVSDGEAEVINVVFSNGEKIAAELVWQDSSLDLAVVKVDKNGLTPIEIGNSDEVAVGDKAIAIGNPLGLDLQSTLTSGVISGLNRTITLENNTSMDGLMQTDASINGGNSGGALLNSKGQLIGINTAKASKGEGIGFAIPINTAKSIVDKIIETGTFEAVTLGIQGTNLEVYENYLNIDTGAEQGAVIMQVDEKSPAGKAGLEQNDIVIKVDDKDIKDMNSLRSSLIGYSYGDKAKLTIIRNKKEVEIEVTFEKYKAEESSKNNKENKNSKENNNINPFGENEEEYFNPFR